MPSPTHIYVTYVVRPRWRANSTESDAQIPQSATIKLPQSMPATDLPAYLQHHIRPLKEADPSDGYRGQSPDEVIILNMVKLEDLV